MSKRGISTTTGLFIVWSGAAIAVALSLWIIVAEIDRRSSGVELKTYYDSGKFLKAPSSLLKKGSVKIDAVKIDQILKRN
jgi:hypothetical protein